MSYDDVVENAVGVVTGTNVAVQLAGIGIGKIRFKVASGSIGPVYLGVNGTATFPIFAGEDTGWCNADDLADYWYRSPSGTLLHYWFQK